MLSNNVAYVKVLNHVLDCRVMFVRCPAIFPPVIFRRYLFKQTLKIGQGKPRFQISSDTDLVQVGVTDVRMSKWRPSSVKT